MSVESGLETVLVGIPNSDLGVAVSGGGDSVALLHMLAKRGAGLRAVTVDHGLRAESVAEAAQVAALCQTLNIPHTTLKWQNYTGTGNMQDAARNARLTLISQWAAREGISHIALGHTFDDQAETVLLRLARGSGVDGLSGMAASRKDGAVTWVRPLLHARRDTLREYLRSNGIDWIDDPSNDDLKYDRVKARQALLILADLGVTPEGLVTTAAHMQDARAALEQQTLTLAQACTTITDCGEVVFARATFENAPAEIQHRLLAAALMWISGDCYRPRFDSLSALLSAQTDQTLHGCIIRHKKNQIVIRRELARVSGPQPLSPAPWDHRWQVSPATSEDGYTIAVLGDKGLQECVNWRETGHPREALLTTPAIWSDQQLIAAPLAGFANGWEIKLKNGKKAFFESLMTR